MMKGKGAQIDIYEEMNASPLKKGDCCFVRIAGFDTVCYKYRPAKVLSEVRYQRDPDNPDDTEEHPYIELKFMERLRVLKQNESGLEWRGRVAQAKAEIEPSSYQSTGVAKVVVLMKDGHSELIIYQHQLYL